MRVYHRAAVLALLVFSVGCSDRSAIERAEATPVPSNQELISGTPAGDLEDWATDVRKGLAAAGELMDSDRAGLQKQILDLYVTRQEYMEMYYGPTGRMQPRPVLSEAVKTAEARFHDLMILTGSTPAAKSEAIRAALAALDAQLAIVLEQRDQSVHRVRGAAR